MVLKLSRKIVLAIMCHILLVSNDLSAKTDPQYQKKTPAMSDFDVILHQSIQNYLNSGLIARFAQTFPPSSWGYHAITNTQIRILKYGGIADLYVHKVAAGYEVVVSYPALRMLYDNIVIYSVSNYLPPKINGLDTMFASHGYNTYVLEFILSYNFTGKETHSNTLIYPESFATYLNISEEALHHYLQDGGAFGESDIPGKNKFVRGVDLTFGAAMDALIAHELAHIVNKDLTVDRSTETAKESRKREYRADVRGGSLLLGIDQETIGGVYIDVLLSFWESNNSVVSHPTSMCRIWYTTNNHLAFAFSDLSDNRKIYEDIGRYNEVKSILIKQDEAFNKIFGVLDIEDYCDDFVKPLKRNRLGA